MANEGKIYRISGPVVTAIGMEASMYDVVRVGDEGLMGEVIELHGEKAVIQVYEDTSVSDQVNRLSTQRRLFLLH